MLLSFYTRIKDNVLLGRVKINKYNKAKMRDILHAKLTYILNKKQDCIPYIALG